MANYQVVDIEQLENDLTTVADAIRAKGGTTEKLVWSFGYKAAVEAISGDTGNTSLLNGSITSITNKDAEHINNYACAYCIHLESVDLPSATIINSSAFYGCTSLKTVNIPAAEKIYGSAFEGCNKLPSIVLPMAEIIESSAFARCVSLVSADFPSARYLLGYTLNECSALVSLILRGGNVPKLNENALTGTPIASGTGYIYVPAALIETYKVATNWSNYAAQFRALEDYTVDGTITGELDETKI